MKPTQSRIKAYQFLECKVDNGFLLIITLVEGNLFTEIKAYQ